MIIFDIEVLPRLSVPSNLPAIEVFVHCTLLDEMDIFSAVLKHVFGEGTTMELHTVLPQLRHVSS